MPRFPSGLALLIAGAVVAALASGAQAASARLWETCKGKDVHAAIGACEQILSGKENLEDQAIALTNRGRAYDAIGQSERALADLTRAIELNANSAAAFSNRSDVYYSKGDYERAIADATRAIELDPTVAIFFNARGMAYADKGEHDRAIADYARAIALDPTFAFALYRRGVAYLKTGKRDLARADIEKALQLAPDDGEARSALAELEQAETAPGFETTASSASDLEDLGDLPDLDMLDDAADVGIAKTLKIRLVGKVYEGDELDNELVTEGWEDLGGGLMIEPVWFHYFRRNDGTYLVLANMALPRRRPDAKNLPFRITDVLVVPPLEEGQEVAFYCRVKGSKRKLAIVAVIQPDHEKQEEWWKDIRRAWTVSLDSGQLATIDTDGVECVNEGWGL